MFKILISFMVLTVVSFAVGDYGIFPTETELNMNSDDYWSLCGLLGLVCGYIFWEKLFR